MREKSLDRTLCRARFGKLWTCRTTDYEMKKIPLKFWYLCDEGSVLWYVSYINFNFKWLINTVHCVGLNTRPGESYRVWFVINCDQVQQ